MLGTKEIYDVMEMFEKTIQKTFSVRLDKEEKSDWHRKYYYQDGKANELFIAFLSGYSYAKAMAISGHFQDNSA